MSWTLGEGMTETFSNDSNILTRGFQQVFDDTFIFYTISGKVYKGSSLLQEGVVKLFRADVSELFSAVNEVQVVNGEYKLNFVSPAFNYYIYALPDDTSNYHPTYFGDKVLRSQAYSLYLNAFVWNADIHLVPRTSSVEKLSIIETSVFLYPNPINNKLNLLFNCSEYSDIRLSIINIRGQVIMQKTLLLPSGLHTTTINTHSIAQGYYFININTNNQIETLPFLK